MAYASPYYDPVKAHEYYMEHRELKGKRAKTSTASLNEIGKAAAGSVKQSLQAEKKEKIKQHTEAMNSKIKALRERLNALSPSERKNQKADIEAAIKQLRAANETFKKQLGLEYDSKYEEELQNIKSDESMRQETDRKSTAGLNEEGKEEAKKAKEEIEAKKEKEINEYSIVTSKQIEKIESQLKSMTPKQRNAMGERFKTKIQSLRDENASKRKEFIDSYNEQYYSKLDELKKNSKYQA